MSVIRASVTDQRLKITEAPVLASGGQNETKIVFTFCEKWEGFTRVATFYRDESDPYSMPLDANDTCVVPWEVCYESGTFYIGVFGDKDGVRRTSTTARYKVKRGALTDGSSPSEPTPDRYTQIANELQEHIKNCGGGSGGGGSVLIVTLDEENCKASHTPRSIYNHVQNGGTAYVLTDFGGLSVLVGCTDDYAVFDHNSDDSFRNNYFIDSNGSFVRREYQNFDSGVLSGMMEELQSYIDTTILGGEW